MSLKEKMRHSMSLNVIGSLVGLMLIFGLAVAIIGYRCIVDAFKNEYSTVTYHMADSAAAYVNGDLIDEFLQGREKEEYNKTKEQLEICCQKLNVSMIYVIRVDQKDYGQFASIFNPVNNSVDNSNYREWNLGYKRGATNNEYRQKYRTIYEQKAPYEPVFRMNPTDGQHPHITTMVPIKNSEGTVTAILCMQRPVREMVDALKPYYLLILSQVFVMVILISILASLFIRKAIIGPVAKVSEEATRFAQEGTKGESLVEISHYDVIRDLAGSIDSMETEMLQNIDTLTKATADKERIGAELSIAATIQKDSLPDVFPAFPHRKDFEIRASMDPAKEVGGDFYNFFLIHRDQLAVVMADVSGKGIPAALFMMLTNILIESRARMGGTPGEILAYVNKSICKRNRADMFVTVWLGILNTTTGRMVYANAGHEDAAIYRKGGQFEITKEKHSFVLGGIDGIQYQDREIQLNKGDKLFLYTDGVPEATDKDNQMFTLQRMLDSLNEHKEKSPEKILDGVRNDVNTFVWHAPQFDDMTMLCMEIKEDTIEPPEN